MQVRLAFSVAAHLDTEILIVDEVLAVGDAAFQQKCIGKMSDVAGAGKTVLFVSHNLAAVRRMCPRSLLLEAGTVVADGNTGGVIDSYLSGGEARVLERRWPDTDEAPGDDAVRLLSISITDPAGETADSFAIGDDLSVTVKYRNLVAGSRASVGIHLWSAEGVHLFASHDFVNQEWAETPRAPGLVTATCGVPGHFLAEGRYLVTMTISTFTPTLVHHVVEREVLAFSIVDQTEGEGVRGPVSGDWPGVVRPMLHWTLAHEDAGRPV
jgi:lipopolysaccharide transport system ATP-binding protein